MNKILFLLVLVSLIFIIGCDDLNIESSSRSLNTKEIIDKCKCREYCFGEKIYAYCLIEESETPQDCQSFIGLYLGRSYDGSKILF